MWADKLVEAIAFCEAMASTYEADTDYLESDSRCYAELIAYFKKARAALEFCADELGIELKGELAEYDSLTQTIVYTIDYKIWGTELKSLTVTV